VIGRLPQAVIAGLAVIFFSTVLLAQEIKLTHKGPKKPFNKLPKFKDHTLAVFAIAPEVNSPVSVIAEPGGAVYALCDKNAGMGLQKHQGSILRLIDKDGDGKADTMTKFVSDIDTPRGGHFVNNTLYVMHPPYVSSFRDTDGDGVADEHKILAQGFGHDLDYNRGGDHTSNDLRVGIDGWIYTAIGDFGATATGSDGSKVQLLGGGVIRMRMDGSDLELFARGTRNTYDIAVSHKMDIIALDNTNDGDGWDMRLHHLTPLAHMGYPHLYKFFNEDAMPPLFEYGGGSGVGAIYLQEPGFPEWFNNRFHTISWGRMYSHSLEANGATFVNKDIQSLKLAKLLDLDVDGSSRLYFANFDNGGARTEPGTEVGRIIQVKPDGWQFKEFPDLQKATVEQLINSLSKGSNVLRHNAQLELISRQEKQLEDKLQDKAKDKKSVLEARIAALYAINLRNKKGTVETLKSFLNDSTIKEYALRALLDREDKAELSLDEIIKDCLKDLNPRVQLQAIVGVQKLGLKSLTTEVLALSDDSTERTPLVKGVAHVHHAVPHTARRALVLMQPVSELIAAMKQALSKKTAFAVLRQIHDKAATTAIISEVKKAQPSMKN
jgi:hypothetical protein